MKIQTLYISVILMMGLLFVSGCGQDDRERLEFNGGELYYTTGVSTDVANKLGKYLISRGVFNGKEITIQVDKNGGTYEVRMPIKPGMENDPKYIELTKRICLDLSINVFEGSKVDMHLCDKDLKTIRVVNGM